MHSHIHMHIYIPVNDAFPRYLQTSGVTCKKHREIGSE